MPLPTFVIVGAQKCGTSTLHRMLRDHPQVHMSATKELHFFDKHWDRGLPWYEEQFRPSRRQKQVGETTPAYMFRERARRRLLATLPDARVVMILRNPTDRAYSHYWHDVRLNKRNVPRSFEEALEQERPGQFTSLVAEHHAESSRPVAVRRDSYVGRGQYLEQILPFVTAYGRDRVHVMLLEDLVTDRETALRGLFSFLHVSPRRAKAIKAVRANRYRQPDATGRTRPAEYAPMAQPTRDLLARYYRPHNDRLGEWLGRDLSHWQ